MKKSFAYTCWILELLEKYGSQLDDRGAAVLCEFYRQSKSLDEIGAKRDVSGSAMAGKRDKTELKLIRLWFESEQAERFRGGKK